MLTYPPLLFIFFFQFFVFLLIIFLLEIGAGISAFVWKEKVFVIFLSSISSLQVLCLDKSIYLLYVGI